MKIINFILIVVLFWLFPPLNSSAALPGFMQKKMGTMSGQIFIDGIPQPFALISFFQESKGLPPVNDGMRRVPEFLSRTDAEGKFKINIVVGSYYIGVLLRKPGDVPGPPREGEKFYFVSSSAGELSTVKINVKEIVDKGRLNAVPPESFKLVEEYFTVEGTVLGEKGAPVKGVVVLGKSQLNIPRPEFISSRTDEEGHYQLKLPPDKSFYLVARETIAGAKPEPGSNIGTYGIESKTGLAAPSIFGSGNPPPSEVGVKTNNKALVVRGKADEKISDVNIFMYTVPDPEKIRVSIQGTVNYPKFEMGETLDNISFAYNNHKLDLESYRELGLWVTFLKGREDIKIELRGYTDSLENSEDNLHLAEDRVQAVADYLVLEGIKPNRLVFKYFGPDNPLSTNDTSEERHQNRRVEIKILD